jgi:hypothetical protein
MSGIMLEQRRDGRLYPAGGSLEPAERNRARWLAHRLVHAEGRTIRAAQAALLEQGIRRSVGSIAKDLARYACPACAPEQFPGG